MRVLLTIATVVAVLAALAGCGGDDETTTTPATTSPAPTGATGATGSGGDGEGTTTEDGARGDANEGSDGGAPSGAGSDPEGALEEFFTSGDADLVCGELATPELIASAYGDEQGCRQAQVPAAIPKSIEIKDLEASGDTAEAVVVPRGGPNDGFDHEVTLVDEDGTWRVDSLEADIPAGP